jgi:hypothetical protein
MKKKRVTKVILFVSLPFLPPSQIFCTLHNTYHNNNKRILFSSTPSELLVPFQLSCWLQFLDIVTRIPEDNAPTPEYNSNEVLCTIVQMYMFLTPTLLPNSWCSFNSKHSRYLSSVVNSNLLTLCTCTFPSLTILTGYPPNIGAVIFELTTIGLKEPVAWSWFPIRASPNIFTLIQSN